MPTDAHGQPASSTGRVNYGAIPSHISSNDHESLPSYSKESYPSDSTPPPASLRRMGAAIFISTLLLASLAFFTSATQPVPPLPPLPSFAPNQVSTYDQVPFLSFDQYHLWAHLSPYHPVKPYQPPPKGCKATQVNLIQRHGARFPTTGASMRIKTVVDKLKNAQAYLDPRMAFMEDYVYDLGANDLVEFGAIQSRDSGIEHLRRYWNIISTDNIPFVRASGSERVILSATNWTLGVALASNNIYRPQLSVILPENLNDTLDDSMCPAAGDSDVQTEQWLDIYGPPIAARLNAWAPGANLTGDDIFDLISLCPFDSVAKQTFSPFCALFTEEDLEGFEYNGDLDKYYGTGYGQPLGPVQGVGYINELIARLTNSPVRDNTQTNSTLDSDPATFPLNRTFYADFSHDNQMIAIYSAMGLFMQKRAIDPVRPKEGRSWRVGWLVPFSAQMVTERLECVVDEVEGAEHHPDHHHRRRRHRDDDKGETRTYVRILVNDAVQPLEFCGGNEDGLCELDRFVESQAYARNDGDGDFEKCFDEVPSDGEGPRRKRRRGDTPWDW
ncbi:hypothetical protein AX16_003928 [Volvariella volvacea WC 439]|nr:hypothetical protein AX16_003928 [Volvariella volvacea WC 439]